MSITISINDNQVKRIESSLDNAIRIWDFYSGKNLKKIQEFCKIRGIYIWNVNYLIVAGREKNIRFINIRMGRTVYYLSNHENSVFNVKKIYFMNLGYYLISQGYKDSKIILWNISEEEE